MGRTRRAAVAAAAALALGVAGCSPGTDPIGSATGATFAADPSSLLLGIGEQQSVTVYALPAGPTGTVTWTSSDTKVVTVDGTPVALGAGVTVQAVGAGTASLRGVVTTPGLQTTISVAVRVRTG